MSSNIELVRSGLNHWLLDALGGTKMHMGVRGAYTTFNDTSGNSVTGIFAVNASNQIVIPPSKYGNKVVNVRGVWLPTVEFTWAGYWSTTTSESDINYYSSHVVGTSTVITLNDTFAEGTELQVFYYHEGRQGINEQILTAETYYNSYPYFFKSYGGPFPEEYREKISAGWFSSASDAEYWYIVACYEAFLYTGKEYFRTMATTMIEKCREYELNATSHIETFDYPLAQHPDGIWAKSEFGTSVGTIEMLAEIATDPNDLNNYVLHVKGDIGTWGLWGKYIALNTTLGETFKFRIKGNDLAAKPDSIGIIIITITLSDSSQYSYAFLDNSVSWKSYELDSMYAWFRSIVNIVYSDFASTWWSFYGGASVLPSVFRKDVLRTKVFFVDPGFGYHKLSKLQWSFSGLTTLDDNYAGFIVGVPAGCTDMSGNLVFAIYSPNNLNFDIMLKDDVAAEYTYSCEYRTPLAVANFSIALSSFTPSAVGKTFEQLHFKLKNSSTYYNEVRWPDKKLGSTGGTWKNTASSITIYDDTATGSFVEGSTTYSKVVRVATDVQPDWVEPVYDEFGELISEGYFIDGYAGFSFTVPEGVDSSDYSNLTYAFRTTKAQTLKTIIKDYNSVSHEINTAVAANQVIRHDIAFSAFPTLVHPIQQIQFEFTDTGVGETYFGEMRFGDALSVVDPSYIYVSGIQFGSTKVHPGGAGDPVKIMHYQFHFPVAANVAGKYAIDMYFDDVGVDYTPPDDYYGLPYKSYQWGDGGKKGAWVGSMYMGYLIPAAYYHAGYTTEAALCATAIRAAQVAFATRMGRATDYGLFMPVHTRAVGEGAEDSDTGENNIFSFGTPGSSQMEWGGWQYRILAQLAHYYYLTGDTTAKDVLWDAFSWISDNSWTDVDRLRIPNGVKREGVVIRYVGAIGSSYITLKGCLPSVTDWVNTDDIIYIENDTTMYKVIATGSHDTDSGGYAAIYITPNLVAQADVGEKVLVVATSKSNPHEQALLLQAALHTYWRGGNAQALSILQRMMYNLTFYTEQSADGAYYSGSKVYSFHQAEIGKALGMLLRGNSVGGTTVYSTDGIVLAQVATSFGALYDYIMAGRGSAKPCSINMNGIPLHIHQNESQVVESGAAISNTATTSEAISLSMHFALWYAMYGRDVSGVITYDGSWINELTDHLYHVVLGGTTPDYFNWTLEEEPDPPRVLFGVSSTDPVSDAVDVPLNTAVSVTFTQELDTSTVGAASFTLKIGAAPVAGTVASGGKVATFTPSAPMTASTVYTATLTVAITDLNGNPLAAEYTWDFTTGTTSDTTAPTVVSTTPGTDAVDVATDATVSVEFSETMDWQTITSAHFTLYKGATQVPANISYSGVTAVLTPLSPLANNQLYEATVNTGVTDLAGNAIAAPYVWSFTTQQSLDTTAPTVVLTDPADTATNVPNAQIISASFSEEMDITTLTTSTFTLYDGGTPIAGTVACIGDTATFTPDADLSVGTTFTATITTGVTDLAGNALASSYIWTFSTQVGTPIVDSTPPTVSSVTPTANSTNVDRYTDITATFSKSLDPSTVSSSTVVVFADTTQIYGTATYTGGILTITFDPTNPLLYSSVVKCKLTTGLKDLSGNALATDYIWYFTVEAAPVAEGAPGEDEVSVPPVKRVRVPVDTSMLDSFVKFSTPMTATVIGGLWHLNGQSVTVIADGEIIDGHVVENGKITLDTPASVVYIGKKYEGRILTNRFDFHEPDATHGLIQRVIGLTVRVTDTGTFKFGTNDDNLLEVNPKNWEGDEVDIMTGDILDRAFPGRFIKESSVLIVQDQPLPTTINALILETEIGIK